MKKPKWPKKHCKRVKVHLYGSHIFAFNNRKHFAKAADYLGTDLPQVGIDGLSVQLEHTENGSSIYLLGVFDGKLSTLVHEVAHIAHFVTARAGFDSGVGNGEPYAYLIGHMFDKLEKFIKEK